MLVYKIFDISGLSDNEYVNLVGHLNRLLLDGQTVEDISTRGYTREQIEAMHQAMKKRGKKDIPEVRSLDVSFRTDLKQLQFPQFDFIYSMYSKYDKFGVLPFPGSHSEQPAKIIEIFDILGAIHAEDEKRVNNK